MYVFGQKIYEICRYVISIFHEIRIYFVIIIRKKEQKLIDKKTRNVKASLPRNAFNFLLNHANRTCSHSPTLPLHSKTLMAAIEDHDDVSVILEEQREEIMAAKTLARDHDLAFNLQMQEALAVSRAAHTSSSSSSPQSPKLDFADDDDEGFDYTSLILEDIARVDQERRDREFGAQEMKRLKLDLDRRIHDQRFAKEIMNIPDADWSKDGDFFHKPYSLGSASSSSSSSVDKVPAVEGECFRVYCKGLVSEEMIGETRVTVGGVGVAICDSADNLIWEVSKVLGAEESKSPEIAELEAIVRGLDEALNFDLGSVTFFIDDFKLFNYVSCSLSLSL